MPGTQWPYNFDAGSKAHKDMEMDSKANKKHQNLCIKSAAARHENCFSDLSKH